MRSSQSFYLNFVVIITDAFCLPPVDDLKTLFVNNIYCSKKENHGGLFTKTTDVSPKLVPRDTQKALEL
jgi:hypothetical protein